MRGIILKDLYDNFCIPKNAAFYIFGALAISIGFFIPSEYYYVLISGVILPLFGCCALKSPTEQEESSSFNKLLITFPNSKAQIVTAKYLLGLGFVILFNFLALLWSMVQVYIHHTIRLTEALRMWGIGISISLLFLAVIYVGFFLLGKRNGTIFFITITCLIAVVWGASSALLGIQTILSCSPGLVICLIFSGAVMIVLSCLVSIGIYSRRYSTGTKNRY